MRTRQRTCVSKHVVERAKSMDLCGVICKLEGQIYKTWFVNVWMSAQGETGKAGNSGEVGFPGSPVSFGILFSYLLCQRILLSTSDAMLLRVFQGSRGFPGTPGPPGLKGHRVTSSQGHANISPRCVLWYKFFFFLLKWIALLLFFCSLGP